MAVLSADPLPDIRSRLPTACRMTSSKPMSASVPQQQNEFIVFVTGRLAERSLREVVAGISERLGFRYEVVVPGIQVAALLHTSLLKSRLSLPEGVDRVILPGWVRGDLDELNSIFNTEFERGPRDLRNLPEHFGLGKRRDVDLSGYSIEIIAEINHATHMPLPEILKTAQSLTQAGANVIDIGCVPGECSPRVREIVTELTSRGMAVSIDSFDQQEVTQAVDAGASLILSANQSNIEWVTESGVEVVAIPDSPEDVDSLHRTMEQLERASVPFRIDPIVEPVGVGFTDSLQRYMTARREYPHAAMMMGVGNVTELAEVDSAGVNFLLAAVCEELGIQSVLTTQVINWCRTAVSEFDAARRLVHHAVTNRVIAKHLNSALVMLRDPQEQSPSVSDLRKLADALTDRNFRIFTESGTLHLMNSEGHWSGPSAFDVFTSAANASSRDIDSGHAFYLGYELARAEIAGLLGKKYQQDEPLRWGVLGESPSSSTVGRTGEEGH